MKNIIGIVVSILVGIIIGFFGVLNSVFSDGELNERIVFIAIILVVYCVLAAVLGYLLPKFSWKWGLLLGGPGVLFLFLFTILEFNPYLLIYLMLILILSCGGALGGSAFRMRVKK